jgi:hypothetical protein
LCEETDLALCEVSTAVNDELMKPRSLFWTASVYQVQLNYTCTCVSLTRGHCTGRLQYIIQSLLLIVYCSYSSRVRGCHRSILRRSPITVTGSYPEYRSLQLNARPRWFLAPCMLQSHATPGGQGPTLRPLMPTIELRKIIKIRMFVSRGRLSVGRRDRRDRKGLGHIHSTAVQEMLSLNNTAHSTR